MEQRSLLTFPFYFGKKKLCMLSIKRFTMANPLVNLVERQVIFPIYHETFMNLYYYERK